MTNFINQLSNGLNNIIPVVCDDMFEYVNPNNVCSTSINEFVCDALGVKVNSKLYKTIRNNFYYGMSLSKEKASGIYNAIEKAVNEQQIRLKECVRDFLVKGDFPLIVTTFAFPIIEKCIEESGNEVKSEYYNIDSRNDIPLVFGKVYNKYVYHVFGGERFDRWVYNEQTLLQHMYALQNADAGAKNLTSYICPTDKPMKQLLVMGSILPDWLFRFLVYPIYQDKLQSVGGFWISAQNTAQELKHFLIRNEYRLSEASDSIPNILRQAVEGRNMGETKCSKHYIFVSYKRDEEDNRIGRVIELLRLYGQVWVDFEKVADAGNPYWKNIKEGIRKCDVFIPLVTDKYIDFFTQHQKDDLKQLSKANPNDNDIKTHIEPIIREAYYAKEYEKKICPIVISSNPAEPGKVEETMSKAGWLSSFMFSERNIIRYDDNNPTELNIIFNDKTTGI